MNVEKKIVMKNNSKKHSVNRSVVASKHFILKTKDIFEVCPAQSVINRI